MSPGLEQRSVQHAWDDGPKLRTAYLCEKLANSLGQIAKARENSAISSLNMKIPNLGVEK